MLHSFRSCQSRRAVLRRAVHAGLNRRGVGRGGCLKESRSGSLLTAYQIVAELSA
jgi:hypothetical protein